MNTKTKKNENLANFISHLVLNRYKEKLIYQNQDQNSNQTLQWKAYANQHYPHRPSILLSNFYKKLSHIQTSSQLKETQNILTWWYLRHKNVMSLCSIIKSDACIIIHSETRGEVVNCIKLLCVNSERLKNVQRKTPACSVIIEWKDCIIQINTKINFVQNFQMISNNVNMETSALLPMPIQTSKSN